MPTNKSDHFLEEIKRLDFENKKYMQLLNDVGMNNGILSEDQDNAIFLQNIINEKEILINLQKKKLDDYKRQLEVNSIFFINVYWAIFA